MASLLVGLHDTSAPLAVSVFPQVPVEGEPLQVSFNLNNPSASAANSDYQLYANGELVMEGSALLSPSSSKKYQYTYVNPLEMGEQITFMVKSSVGDKDYTEYISLPAYPPQVWSSFVSFASFSTTVMTSMTTMSYYDQSFTSGSALNIGVIFSVVLILMLIYLELTEPRLQGKSVKVLGNLRVRFSRLSGVLFIIFVGMVFTQIALIIGKVG